MNDGKSSEFSWFIFEWIHSAETWLDRHVRNMQIQCSQPVQTHKGTFTLSCMRGFSLLNAPEHAKRKHCRSNSSTERKTCTLRSIAVIVPSHSQLTPMQRETGVISTEYLLHTASLVQATQPMVEFLIVCAITSN